MSREVRRVPLDFDWPLNETWKGYLMPEDLRPLSCTACGDSGLAPGADLLHKQWWGNAPFRPEETGSTPLTETTPAVRAFAERNVEQAPWYYGTGEDAIVREARRLATLWNGMWSHHLEQADVDALLAADELHEFTHVWVKDEGWQPRKPVPHVTAAQVNDWTLSPMCSLSAGPPIEAKCARLGFRYLCSVCGGSGEAWRDDAHKAAHEAWEPTEPPKGDGWQLWETIGEGSPVTPVFATAEELVDYLATVGEPGSSDGPYRREAAEALVAAGSTVGSFMQAADGKQFDAARDADAVEQLHR
jgi:hypothetical protein